MSVYTATIAPKVLCMRGEDEAAFVTLGGCLFGVFYAAAQDLAAYLPVRLWGIPMQCWAVEAPADITG